MTRIHQMARIGEGGKAEGSYTWIWLECSCNLGEGRARVQSKKKMHTEISLKNPNDKKYLKKFKITIPVNSRTLKYLFSSGIVKSRTYLKYVK